MLFHICNFYHEMLVLCCCNLSQTQTLFAVMANMDLFYISFCFFLFSREVKSAFGQYFLTKNTL